MGCQAFKFLLVEPLKYGANEVAELDDHDLPRYVRITDIKEDGTLRDDTFKSLLEEIAQPYLLKEGDLLFARSGATVGKTFLYQESWGRAAYAGYLIRARVVPTKVLPKFSAYFVRSNNYWNWLHSNLIQATIQNISAERYSGLMLGVPTTEEQVRIVEYLDRKTVRIDARIEKKQRQVELLQEKRAALISHAVLRGLDPNAPLKDSGIAWIGRVPAHWKISKIKYVAALRSGHTPSRQHPEYCENCTIPRFSLADVWQLRDGRREYLGETSEKISELGLAHCAADLLPAGTVIVSRTASVGFSGIMPEPMATIRTL